MNETEVAAEVLKLTTFIMTGFGLVVLAIAVVARLAGRSCRGLVVRYLAWFLIIPPILLPLVYSRIAFQAVTCVVSLLCFREFSRACGLWRDRGLVILCYGLVVATYLLIAANSYGLHQAMPIFTVAALVVVPLVRNEYAHMIQKVCLALLGVLYFGWFLSYLACLRALEVGVGSVFFIMVLVECNDACSYLWGSLMGRRKLARKISPDKTLEGAAGGALCVAALACLLRDFAPFPTLAGVLVSAAAISLLGLCGDLTVSVIKRDLNVKDMGRAIPGHGGVLDRVDSLILCAPAFFRVVRWIHA